MSPGKQKKSAVFFDLDGTWFRWQLFHTWIREAVRHGILPKVVLERAHDSYERYRDRTHPFSQFVSEQVSAYQEDGRLKGVRVSDVSFVARNVIRRYGKRVHVFTRELSRAAVDVSMERVIISGTMTEVVKEFAEANSISIYLGTEHPQENGVYLGLPPVEWALKKGQAMWELAHAHGLDFEHSVAIGDSMTDAEMFNLVRYPICFNPAKALLARARQSRWPIVFEKKDVQQAFRPDARGRFQEVDIIEILPEPLGKALQERLHAIG